VSRKITQKRFGIAGVLEKTAGMCWGTLKASNDDREAEKVEKHWFERISTKLCGKSCLF
jgi:hypothetical protein